MSALPVPFKTAFDDRPTGARILAFPGANCPTVRCEPPQLTDAQRDELNRMRWLALRSRLTPRPDIERACFLLAGEPGASLDRCALAFFHGLAQRAHREMIFYRPGTSVVSDDEMWMIRLFGAHRAGRHAVAAALVKWRIRADSHRWLRFLSERLAFAL